LSLPTPAQAVLCIDFLSANASGYLPKRKPQRRPQLGTRHSPPPPSRSETPGHRQEKPQSPARFLIFPIWARCIVPLFAFHPPPLRRAWCHSYHPLRANQQKLGISPDMAVRLSKVFSGIPESGLTQQAHYDLAHFPTSHIKIKTAPIRAISNDKTSHPASRLLCSPEGRLASVSRRTKVYTAWSTQISCQPRLPLYNRDANGATILFVSDGNMAQAAAIQTLTKRQRKASLGQFFTPEPIANFMASLFEFDSQPIDLLDAGGGNGALSAAVVRSILTRKKRPRRVTITAYDIDSAVISQLNATLESCSFLCDEAGIDFSYQVLHKDFIFEAVDLTRGGLFTPRIRGFTAAIVNPPYKKIRSDSPTRAALRRAGIETSNLYAGFVALIGRLLVDGGQLVAITPRSFCNGPYFRPFRFELLQSMSIRRIHTFDSRSEAFRSDEVLQENLILHAIKGAPKPHQITISSSSGRQEDPPRECTVRYADVVSPEDTDQFIRVTTADEFARSESSMGRLRHTLPDLGLEVSTGRVVDFRAKLLLRPTPTENTVPLIYPSHFQNGYVRWPNESSRKPNAIVNSGESKNLLVPAGIYVLVKRFSAKEERRRIVACLYDPSRVAGSEVGFENHLNYFHVGGCGVTAFLAKGLAVFLNSTSVDLYFRQFSGHTQVNATDLRKLPYPPKDALERLGQRFDEVRAFQQEIDRIVEEELG